MIVAVAVTLSGVSADETDRLYRTHRMLQLPEIHQPSRYSLAVHGVGLVDEWPVVPLHPDFEHAHGGHFEENMTACGESLIGEPGGECVKLDNPVPGHGRRGRAPRQFSVGGGVNPRGRTIMSGPAERQWACKRGLARVQRELRDWL